MRRRRFLAAGAGLILGQTFVGIEELLSFVSPPTQAPEPGESPPVNLIDNSLEDLVLVLDPGHGEFFPKYEEGAPVEHGASRLVIDHQNLADGKPSKYKICESAYTWDLCLRIQEEVRRRGGTVQLTLREDDLMKLTPVDNISGIVLPVSDRKVWIPEVDKEDAELLQRIYDSVKTEKQALQTRCNVGNHYYSKFEGRKFPIVRFISIHYDSRWKYMPDLKIGKDGGVQSSSEQNENPFYWRGPRILQWPNTSEYEITKYMRQAFQSNCSKSYRDEEKRDSIPIYRVRKRVINPNGRLVGKYSDGRNKYDDGCFSGLQPILIEVAHIANDKDVLRMIRYEERQKAAETIVDGLVRYMKAVRSRQTQYGQI